MNTIDPKYPWCTGVPRPTLVSNIDAQEVLVSYFTAPICEPICRTALIRFLGATRVESRSENDDHNPWLKRGIPRDCICVRRRDGRNEYTLLFHNEVIVVLADAFEELPGAPTALENLARLSGDAYERD